MDLQLRDRVVLVVGGTGTIGSVIAQTLRVEGATVLTAARGGADVGVDVTDDASVAAAVAEVLRRHGRLDGLVVSAAPSATTLDPARSAEPETVAAAIAVKSLGFLRVANAVLPVMTDVGYGRIVAISGQNAYLTGSIAAASRNAVVNVAAKNLADAVAGSGVTVNVVNPGPVTERPGGAVAPAKAGESSPQQIAALVALLLSPLGGGISGEAIATGHKALGVTAL